MENNNVWICPASPLNLQKTIVNRFNGEYIWALNARRHGQFSKITIGDVVLFGNMRKDGGGFTHLGIVNGKRILEDADDQWPFKSPSKTCWKYAFTMEDITPINISPATMREWAGMNAHWQTQTLLSVDSAANVKRNLIQLFYLLY